MHANAIVLGVVFVLLGSALLRWRAAVAAWQLSARSDVLRRSSLSNSEYVDSEVRALSTPEQHRLQRWIVTLFGLSLLGIGAYAVARGLGA